MYNARSVLPGQVVIRAGQDLFVRSGIHLLAQIVGGDPKS